MERGNQLILNAAGEGIYGIDANGHTTFLNPAAEQLLGWNAEELVGKKIHSIIHHENAEGNECVIEDYPIYTTFHNSVIHRVKDEIFWCKYGKAIPVEYTSTPIKGNGRLVGAVIVFRDITEQKNAREKLMSALNEVKSLKHRLEQENTYFQEKIKVDYNHKEIIGRSLATQHLLEQIDMVGPTDATVLIMGESGTGKELIARAIHAASPRSTRPLIKVNCASIPHDLFESEFFGHIKGAFTGAISNRVGRFELADGGTIFLDEVSEIPLGLQSKLLRVLQEQQVERIGESESRKIDVRVIAASNVNLSEYIEKKYFREDLYFRLNVFPIESAPLRERLEDIPLLAQHFLLKAMKKLNKPGLHINVNDMQCLRNYHWPGNVRELENIIERQVILTRTRNLSFHHFSDSNVEAAPVVVANITREIDTEAERKRKQKADIVEALKVTHGKVFGGGGAADLLGIKPTTLSSRIKKLGLNVTDFK